MSMQEFAVLSEDDRRSYGQMVSTARAVVQELGKAWRHPSRHDQERERAALWNVLGLDQACSQILEEDDKSQLLHPSIGATAMRYDVEAGIHMIPELLPYTQEERQSLRSNPAYRSRDFGHGIYDEHLLVFQWHLWIWERRHMVDEGRFVSVPSPDGQLLAEGCGRLADSLQHILTAEQHLS
jgi:hypothetical protein